MGLSMALWVAARKSGGAARIEPGSRRSNPAMVWRRSAASLTVRVMGPACPKKLGAGGPGMPLYPETRPRVGLMVYVPQKFDGIRREPPPSPPVATGARYAATAAAAPPLDPPGVRSVSQGFLPVMPREFSHVPTKPSSEQFVLPSMMPPSRRMRSRNAAWFWGTWSLKMMEPLVVRMPPVIWLSLMGMGRPWRGPRSSPRMMAFSAALACSIAMSWVTRRKEFSWWSMSSMRWRNSSVTSTGETCFDLMRLRRSVADRYARFWSGMMGV